MCWSLRSMESSNLVQYKNDSALKWFSLLIFCCEKHFKSLICMKWSFHAYQIFIGRIVFLLICSNKCTKWRDHFGVRLNILSHSLHTFFLWHTFFWKLHCLACLIEKTVMFYLELKMMHNPLLFSRLHWFLWRFVTK